MSSDESSGECAPMKSKSQIEGGSLTKKAERLKKRKPAESDKENNVSNDDNSKVESDCNDSDYAPKKGSRGGKTGSRTSPTKKRKAIGDDDDDTTDKGDAKKNDDKKFEMVNERLATISEWKGKRTFNVRELYQNDKGERIPGKTLYSITEDEVHELASYGSKREQNLDADVAGPSTAGPLFVIVEERAAMASFCQSCCRCSPESSTSTRAHSNNCDICGMCAIL